jgi:hypothetical protein
VKEQKKANKTLQGKYDQETKKLKDAGEEIARMIKEKENLSEEATSK